MEDLPAVADPDVLDMFIGELRSKEGVKCQLSYKNEGLSGLIISSPYGQSDYSEDTQFVWGSCAMVHDRPVCIQAANYFVREVFRADEIGAGSRVEYTQGIKLRVGGEAYGRFQVVIVLVRPCTGSWT